MPWCPDLLKPEQLQHTGHMEPSITGCHGYPYGSFCCLAAVQSMKERGAACPHGKAWLLLRLRQVWALRTKQAAWNNREVKNLTLLLIYNMLSRDTEKSCPLKSKTKTSKRAPHPALRYDPKYTKATASISNVMLWLESSGVPGLPKPSSSCSLAMTISSLEHFCYELCNQIQSAHCITVQWEGTTNQQLSEQQYDPSKGGGKKKKSKKKTSHSPKCYIHISNCFRNYTDLPALVSANTRSAGSRSCWHVPDTTSSAVHGIRGCSPPNLLRSQLRCAR